MGFVKQRSVPTVGAPVIYADRNTTKRVESLFSFRDFTDGQLRLLQSQFELAGLAFCPV